MIKRMMLPIFLGLLLHFSLAAFAAEPPTSGPLPLRMWVRQPSDLPRLLMYMGPKDVLAFHPRDLELMKQAKGVRKELRLTKQDVNQAEALIRKAKSYGADIVDFNLEAVSKEELLKQELAIGKLVREVGGMHYGFAATMRDLMAYTAEIAPHAEFIGLQGQRFQGEKNFREQLAAVAAKVRKINPKAEIWIQVSINPPSDRQIDAATVVRQFHELEGIADRGMIFYSPTRWKALEQVLNQIRPQKPVSK